MLSDPAAASEAAAALLLSWLGQGGVRRLLVAGGNTPLPLYAAVAAGLRGPLEADVFVLDEYVGVPETDPRTCTNLLRRSVQEAWRVPPARFFGLTPRADQALPALAAHERRIEQAGLDVAVLGLGRNGHLGFNEPGSARDSGARLVDLQPPSIEANRAWFGGEHAPARGATVGLRAILGARRVLLLAFGAAKADAVRAMLRGPLGPGCPASFLRQHRGARAFFDRAAMARMRT